MKKKNGYIELLRFIFCIVIVIHHSGFVCDDEHLIFPFGCLAADFFFMLTGYFAMSHLNNTEEKENKMVYSLKYTVGKLKRVFPYALFGILIIYILEFIRPTENLPISDRILKLQNLPFEALFMPMTGVIPINLFTYRNTPLWFLSVLLMGLPLVMYAAQRYKDVFRGWIVWFLPPILYCYLVTRYGGACPYAQYDGLIYSGVIRGISDLTMGCAIFVLAENIASKKTKPGRAKRILFTALELLLLLFILYSCHRKLGEYDQIFVMYLIALLLLMAFSGLGYTSCVSGKIFDFLGKMSMPIFCIHWGVYKYIESFAPGIDYRVGILLAFAVSFVLSLIMSVLLDLRHKRAL